MESNEGNNQKTILVVDDEQPIVDILAYNLKKEGYITLEANDGVTAVDMALNQKPDLILLDIMLPKMDGLTVCKKIRSKYNIPIDKGVGVFNGDMGIVKEIHEYNQTIVVEFDDLRKVTYPFSMLDELELAYAITIHKSQGSEYPAVVMPLLSGPKQLFNRNLLYTGVTRARNCLTILGSKETLEDMIENNQENMRYSGLSARIREVKGIR